jgi:hypothetical protein
LSLILILLLMVIWTVHILVSDQPDKPSWMLVPLTVIYAVLTIWMTKAALQNADAATRAAVAMEASVDEQRRSRWAAFAANLSFPEGLTYKQNTDGSISIVLGNHFRQPIIGLCVAVWFMDQSPGAAGQIRYSTMMESDSRDIDHDTATVTIRLSPTHRGEAYRIHHGNVALERYKEVFQNELPKSALCMLQYSDRANLGFKHFVYDIVPWSSTDASN